MEQALDRIDRDFGITISGPAGCGKTTVAVLIANILRHRGFIVDVDDGVEPSMDVQSRIIADCLAYPDTHVRINTVQTQRQS